MYFNDIYFSNINAIHNFGSFYCIGPHSSWESPTKVFDQCLFYYVVGGECRITIEGVDYIGRAGDWFFIPAGVERSYSYNTDMRFEKYWMHFDIQPTDIFTVLNLPYCIHVNDRETVDKYFGVYRSIARSNKLVDKLTVKSCLISLIAEYIKLARTETIRVSAKSDKRLEDVLTYIKENIDKNITNEELAERYFAHPNHFIRVFKAKTGQTPAKYIRLQRLECAKRMLESSELSVADIADGIGLNDPAHLSRLFREQFNMTPVEYRRCYKKNFNV
jgi:AraC-like DNA-binding protein